MTFIQQEKNTIQNEKDQPPVHFVKNIPCDLKKDTLEDLLNNMDNQLNNMSCARSTLFIFHMIMTAIAIILSFRCNGKSFNLISFVFALLFPYIYIIYIFATKNISQECDV